MQQVSRGGKQKIVGSLLREAFVFKFLFKAPEGSKVVTSDVSIKGGTGD